VGELGVFGVAGAGDERTDDGVIEGTAARG
jgi:hypothetical protein